MKNPRYVGLSLKCGFYIARIWNGNDVAGRRYALLCEKKWCQKGVGIMTFIMTFIMRFMVYDVCMVRQYFGANIAPSELVFARIDS